MNNCPKKTCIVGFIAVFAFMFGYDFLVHGHLLKGMYEANQSLWRPESQMQQFFPYCLLYHALLAALFTCAYGCWAKKAACYEAAVQPAGCRRYWLHYGIFIGLIMGLGHASAYIYLPIAGDLAVAWFAAALVQGIGIGFVLKLVGGCSSNKDCSV